MSYFIVISGTNATSVDVVSGRLVPLCEAQPYVTNFAARISAADGNPSFFWDDNETGTSSELVWAAEREAFEDRPPEASALGQLIMSCESHGVAARVWWAGYDSDAAFKVPEATSAAALALIRARAGQVPHIGFVLHPVIPQSQSTGVAT